ncbi:MAG: hypothetical protein KGH95_00685 [Thaumarchaeota archaeon]|nr:hypothetical protein [Nitrososphaerota archaeon]
MNKFPNQVTGNIGLYYSCYELSKRGWNVLPTSRNAKGVDAVIYNQNGKSTHTIQIKALTKRDPVPFGNNMDNVIAEFVIICRNVREEKPEIFVATHNEIKNKIHKGEKDGKVSYWLQPKQYEGFKDNWDKIGTGF